MLAEPPSYRENCCYQHRTNSRLINGNPYDLNSLGDIQKLAIPFGFCLQTAEKSRGQLEIRRFLDQTNRLGATYFWKNFRTNETYEKFSKNSNFFQKKIRKNFRKILSLYQEYVVTDRRSLDSGSLKTIRHLILGEPIAERIHLMTNISGSASLAQSARPTAC